MANYRISLLVKSSASADEFIVVRQSRPLAIPLDDETPQHCFADSDLWDIPSSSLSPKHDLTASDVELVETENAIAVQNALENLGLRGFDVSSSAQLILMQISTAKCITQPWSYWKLVEEADFGPGIPTNTLFFMTEVKPDEFVLSEEAKWLTFPEAWKLLVDVNPREDRVGPLASIASSSHFGEPLQWKFNFKLHYQEYPPGVLVVPMNSRTLKPFKKTNLVVFVPDGYSNSSCDDANSNIYGDALIVDPGCHFRVHDQLAEIVASLPQKLVIFVTHHHLDHVEGLSTIQKCNPSAILIAHEATIRRIGKGAIGFKHFNVHGGSTLCIGGQEFRVISAPGHTDGHMALLHIMTQTLIVGDHCVGQGSSVLDATAGGNLKDYMETTRQFLELSPHSIIPMHGRPNLWPTNLLSGYVKHRKQREAKVLKAVEDGASTLYEIVSKAYTDVNHTMWIAAASNVKLHVEHLAYQQKLPADFSMDKFVSSCRIPFLMRWLCKKAQENSYLRFAGNLFPVIIFGVASYMFFKSNVKEKAMPSSDISHQD
ncbi:hypothetical protein SUGI_0119590 [Cryptomeria japonica]|uniref:uncharacterized protein LOC131053990 isoform X2 n=1 Tax=Cryptomeria japonica TaxID=3369 RepID=UPI002408D662|nr:uncharacterized protein LOC131053990 isoform X2 [Cryptomeria japonica]GLJ09982.1 hypothetical protein SUGI_0119590 [Cryptomeria japonica]